MDYLINYLLICFDICVILPTGEENAKWSEEMDDLDDFDLTTSAPLPITLTGKKALMEGMFYGIQ